MRLNLHELHTRAQDALTCPELHTLHVRAQVRPVCRYVPYISHSAQYWAFPVCACVIRGYSHTCVERGRSAGYLCQGSPTRSSPFPLNQGHPAGPLLFMWGIPPQL